MQRLVLALVFAACSSPASPQPEPAKAPPPAEAKPEPKPEPAAPPEPAKPEVQKYADANAALAAMPADLAAVTDPAGIPGYLERLRGIPGVASAELSSGSTTSFAVKLDPPVDAAELVKKFGWTGAHAVSGDVHQKLFAVQLSKGEVEGSKGKRIATEYPHFGAYRVEARLVARPTGKLPKISAGASPAYDLASYTGAVQWLFVMREG